MMKLSGIKKLQKKVCEMFSKKLFIFLIVLLIISHVSFISAAENNQSDAIEINDTCLLSVNNIDEKDYLCELNELDEDDYDETIIDFNQGDRMPITIDSPVEGNLTVLLDYEFYGSWNFSKNRTILIPTYNPNSFYDSSIRNIDIGNHELSLIFNLDSFDNYVPEVYENDSHLKFMFHKCGDDILNHKYTYTHNSSLTIFEKRKTISISLLPYYYFNSFPIYYAGVGFDISFDNINFKEKNKHSFGFILSDSNGRIFIKKNMNITDSFEVGEITNWDGESIGTFCQFWYDFLMLDHNILREIGVCKLTVVNFIDGTNDSIMVNISKFFNYYEKIDCIIQDSDVTFYFYQFFPKVFISIDDNGEYISPKGDKWNVTFANLNSGVHTMNLYCLKTDYSKELLYNLTFKINGLNNIDFPNSIVNMSSSNNLSFCMFPNMLMSNGGFLLGNVNYGMVDFQDMMIADDSSSRNSEHNFDGESISYGEDSGDVGTKGGSTGSSNTRSYEISERSHPKEDLLSKLGIIILSCMSFMIGYNRFDKH